jgi:hypothetical protein
MTYPGKGKIGDIAFQKVLPAFPDGHITKWLGVMEETVKIDAGTIAPGHGAGGRQSRVC